MSLIDVDGVRLHVEELGDGPPALVLHGGLGVDLQPYRTLDPLATHLRLIYLDHRGNGRSDRVDPATMSMEGWAEDALAVGRALAGNDPLLVLGHSYGGFIAQELAIRHPDALAGLLLCNTTPGQLGAGERPAPQGPPTPPEFVELLSRMPETDEQVAAGLARMAPAYVHRARPDDLVRLMSRTRLSAAALGRGFEVLAGWSSVDRLPAVAAPTLLVAGRHDPFCAWPQSGGIADRVDGAELVVLEHSSHFPWLDEPERFFDVVVDWLRRHRLIAPVR